MNNRIKSWMFVVVQAVLLLLLIFFTDSSTEPSKSVVILGNVLKIIGFIILLISIYDLRKSLTVMPAPKEHGVLQIKGLYKYVRHPMYVGVLTLSLGIAVSSGSALKYLIVFALYILFTYKARYEEKLLESKYPDYKSYMNKTRRFIPIKK
jgi:protein-S-isoprenylcysteine O-methyltransferase Ste14